ncbi:protein LPA2 [Hordeum vulgare subsp. vulgare]|uniref:protein LPA2 n=1 Tax=Hordeum vulgare subsp. vulgare TaxID=112509 RepID=UPI001B85A525|nr:protein LPA2 [Hordeum vulgare subsp. vulgare]
MATACSSTSLSAPSFLSPAPSRPRPLFRALAASGSGSGGGKKKSGKSKNSSSSSKGKGKDKALEPPPDVVVRRAPAGSASVFEQQRTEAGFNPGGDGNRPTAEEVRQRQATESAFLFAWLGLGGIILFQGLALAASGFLPTEWDSFLVKYLYPSFTPTVLLFLGGTTGYGVFKYFEGEKSKG